MNLFIPFWKYHSLHICEALKSDLKFKKLVLSEASIQKYHSTCTNADFKAKGIIYGVNNSLFKDGSVNIDIGSGKFKTVQKFLKSKCNVYSILYDPFMQPSSQNQKAVQWVKEHNTFSSTVSNVLNVIAEEDVVLNTINQASRAIVEDGISIFTIYEGDKSGEGAPVGNDGYQRNQSTADYVPMCQQYFSNVDRTGNVIICSKPIDNGKAFWPFDSGLDNGAEF